MGSDIHRHSRHWNCSTVPSTPEIDRHSPTWGESQISTPYFGYPTTSKIPGKSPFQPRLCSAPADSVTPLILGEIPLSTWQGRSWLRPAPGYPTTSRQRSIPRPRNQLWQSFKVLGQDHKASKAKPLKIDSAALTVKSGKPIGECIKRKERQT